jgi:hypothetical protein
MAAKLTIMTYKIAIQLQLVAEICTIYISRARRQVVLVYRPVSKFKIVILFSKDT